MNIFSGSLFNYFLVFVFIVISFSLALYLYKGSDVKKFLKAILVSLRTLSLFLILLLLLNPFLEYLLDSSALQSNIFLLDQSKSSKIENRDSSIFVISKSLTSGNSNFNFYTFGSKLINEVNQFSFDSSENYKYSTNLAAALNNIRNDKEGQINSVSIISDGILNDNNNLIQSVNSLKVPVHYFIFGDTAQKKDISIQKLYFNKQQFVNSKAKVYVSINSYFTEKILNVNLYENDFKIKTNTLPVNKSITQYETEFEVSSASQEIKKYRVEVETVEGEITEINNSEIFYIDYIDNTIKLLLLAGSPGADVSAVKQVLNQSDNFKYDFRIQKNSEGFYEGSLPDLKEYDALILLGYPTEITSIDLLNKLNEDLNKTKTSLIFFNSSNVSLDKLFYLKDNFPFVYNETGKSEIRNSVSITDYKTIKSLQNISTRKVLPLTYFYRGAFSGKPNSTTLGIQNNEPAILFDNTSAVKSAAFLGYGFHKWNLSPNGNYDFLRNLFSDLISLCVNESSKEKFTVKCNKDSYAVSEPVEFLAFYKDVEPAKKYSVKINVTGKDKTVNLELSRLGENNFQGQLQFFEKGDYSLLADLYEDNVKIKSKSLKFSVADAMNEYRETKATDKYLKEISKLSGGVNLAGKTQSELDSIFKSKNTNVTVNTNKSLFRNSFLYLILIIVLLSIEWFIRKRLNLA